MSFRLIEVSLNKRITNFALVPNYSSDA